MSTIPPQPADDAHGRIATRLRDRASQARAASSGEQAAGIALAVVGCVIGAAVIIGALYGLVRLIVWIVAGLFHGTTDFATTLWHSEALTQARATVDAYAAVVARPAVAWLHQHAQGLPVTVPQLAAGWAVLGVLAFFSARRGSLAGRLVWAAVGAATAAAIWQATPAGQRVAATATAAGLWLLAALSAYARRRPYTSSSRTEVALNPALEQALAAALERAVAPAAATQATPAPTPPPAVGFRCKHCHQPLRWAATDTDHERTWRTNDGSIACPAAPDQPALHTAM